MLQEICLDSNFLLMFRTSLSTFSMYPPKPINLGLASEP